MNRTSWSPEDLRLLLSNVSHHLRTPLSVITGRASVLREQVRTDHRRDLDAIVQEALGLSYTFENLLAIIDAGRETTGREWVPLEEIVGAVLVRLAAVFDGRPLTADVPDNLFVHIHPVRGELLIANLLRCAAAHAPLGTPIEIAVKRDSGVVSIDVAGQGSPTRAGEERPTAGDRASRSDSLGLAACHAIIASYGGTIEVAEGAGGGTMFHVRVPDGEPMPDLGGLTWEVE